MNNLIEQIKKLFPRLEFVIKNCSFQDIDEWKFYVSYRWIDWQTCWFYCWDELSKLDIEHIYKYTHEIRLCNTCFNSMDSWYIYNWETYCCETCLPISKEQFEKEYTEDLENYWTEWESIYID